MDFNQFGSVTPPQSGDAHHCAQCEAMLADALDGTLSAADQATFDLHMAGCASCAGMLADARRGLAWMEMLKSAQPEPPTTLLNRIFSETSGKAAKDAQPAIVLGGNDYLRTPDNLLGRPASVPSRTPALYPAAVSNATVLPFRVRFAHGLRSVAQTMLQPRLAMTAAMAFFSIALTLNLTGVRVSSLRPSDFRPSNIMRSCYNAKARVVRYSDNLRVVYELESRVRDLQRSSDNDFPPGTQTTPSAVPQQAPSSDQQPPDDQRPSNQDNGKGKKQARPKPGSGSSRRETPGGNLLLIHSMHHRGTQLASMQRFDVFIPSVFEEEGGLV